MDKFDKNFNRWAKGLSIFAVVWTILVITFYLFIAAGIVYAIGHWVFNIW